MRKTNFQVVINHEEQYSIWPIDRPLEPGWRALPKKGTKEQCLTFIEEVWTDMPSAERTKLKELIRLP